MSSFWVEKPRELSPNHITWILLLSISVPVCLAIYSYLNVLILRRQLPPGPFPLPVFGNHYEIIRWRPWTQFEKWSQQYNSPMITIWLGSRPVILINDASTASELLENRADVYSSRPRMVSMAELHNAEITNQAAMPYGEHWRLHRRLTHTVVGSHVVRNYRSFQSDESKVLTLDFLNEPDDFVMSIERYSVSIVAIIGWGRRIARKNDYVCKAAIASMEIVSFIIPGRLLIDTLPWLTHLPSWLYALPSAIKAAGKMSSRYFFALNQEAAEERPNPSFAKTLLAKQDELGLRDAEVSMLTTNLLGAGVDTTSGTLTSAILALCAFPNVQRKAQAEIDGVCGSPDDSNVRSPTWDDIDANRLPYVIALAKEILRWRTVTVLGGIPHAPIRDYEYRGYTIPAGTQITCNVWAIHRNPEQFPDPDVVRPERYMGKGDGGLDFDYPNTRGHNAFGWGRRACSGQPVAEQSLQIALARMLWAFTIEPGLDDSGKPTKVDIFAYNDSENTRPLPFKARFTPRSAVVKSLIHTEAETAKQRLSQYDGDTKLTMESVQVNMDR